jgi:hypothetical protein
MKKMACWFIILMSCAMLMFSSIAGAGVTQSSPFYFAYGMTGGGWDTSETASVNTPTVQGDFQMVPTVTGSAMTAYGPTFVDAVLADGGNGDMVAVGSSFNVELTGSYSSAVSSPSDFYSVSLDIDDISIYGAIIGGDGSTTTGASMFFSETTAGHEQNYVDTYAWIPSWKNVYYRAW